ncbi:aminotransferase class III-fold pyridoxal phosphate-dependent enzyme [Nocardia puris]|uniref:Acetylornithine/succinyldiaminopimelate/putresci ne aminotransferase n=1 Tax=Nocardia puris TaxID=208602 RepID=A0A366DFG0_9NOCA|nr:aminotransferase class III-fold pyridoxal phosphate-dependent enzyme [Nocardia puris]MBF6214993.1 aminotransferase class III-fold pyridoxal phosphate-dependent enzyme [Nocardia puris]MBF6367240.1 aminotransferase class III-fold pyridoxal phosphate-dependent enzyme [Nocardia puris]MBF6461783.1 aminotransferase class III-fold pyridoxal phosphate-dependent enzyme [Nocardia puris]RBO88239.1 acetylornithine/succinyldiaminopimelate/putrescine aminotransferase [Nocardia puris]
MTAVATEREFAEPYLRGVLATAGLDVEYTRGEGDTLYYRRGDEEIAVLDFVGGYGSTLLGHSNPEIIEYARELLAAQTPIHAQFSRHPYANDVANQLNRIVRRELDSDEGYFAIFANSGAEAIEAGLKHAEFERFVRAAGLRAQIEADIEAAREASVPAAEIDALVAEVTAHNEALFAATPLFLSPVGAFHGKLAGSVQLTYNPNYRAVFSALAAQARFVPVDEPGALDAVVRAESRVAKSLVVEGGSVRVVERPFPVFAAVVLEPILGEGGIHEMPADFVADVQRVAAELGIPVIIDEIQTGMGRTGAFLASGHLGLRGDYYAIAKSLGGGVAKAAVLLVRESRYLSDFELMHSSTFAKDSFSTLIARRVLDILEADDGALYRAAERRGAELLAALRSVREEFPDVVADVRGRGLMAGLEFVNQAESDSAALREVDASGFFGYYVSGFLLREHSIRTFPTSSAVYTLRFEPSVYIETADIERLAAALRDVCREIRDAGGARLAAIA